MAHAVGVLASLEQRLGDHPVSAVTSERSSTVTAFLPFSTAISSASGKGCSSLTETTPTFLPWPRRWAATASASSVTEPSPIITQSASSAIKVMIGLYSRPVRSAYSTIASRTKCGTSLTKWVR